MGSTLGMLARLVVSLGIVLGLMAVAAAVLRRTGAGGGVSRRRGLPIEVVARHSVGRRSSLALVRAGGKGLVLGVTDQQITLLAETDPDLLVPQAEPSVASTPEQPARTPVAPASPWTALLENMREKTLRR
jgi:flagellar protein FliO/FliZ